MTGARARSVGALVAAAMLGASTGAFAQREGDAMPSRLCFRARRDERGASGAYAMDYERERVEPAGFPIVGGNSDIGAMVGLAGTLSYFRDGCRPYFWNMSLAIEVSAKSGPTGFELVEQDYRWQMDIVGVLGGRLRLHPAVFVSRTTGLNYFGVGNGERARPPEPYTGEPGRFNQFGAWDVWALLEARFMVRRPFSLAMSMAYHYADPLVYRGSLLAREAEARGPDGGPLLYGVRPLHLWRTSVTAIYDTRDNELMPRRGLGYGVWASFNRGFPLEADTVYGSVGASLAHYVPIAGPVIFAGRVVTDWQFGRVPFYDAFRGAGPYLIDMPGGVNAIRGVPSGRYSGPIKAYANLELRALLARFTVLRQSFAVGASAFVDVGRLFSDYTFSSSLDGNGPGIKWGSGVGALVRWGQAAVFRFELAYSPDAAAANPGFPFGFYIADHVMF